MYYIPLKLFISVLAGIPPLCLVLYAFQCGGVLERLTLKGFLEFCKMNTFTRAGLLQRMRNSTLIVVIVLLTVFAHLWVTIIGYSAAIILSPVGYWFGTLYRKMMGRK